MRKYIPLVLFIFSWPVLSADIHGRVVRVLGVRLENGNYPTLRLTDGFMTKSCLY